MIRCTLIAALVLPASAAAMLPPPISLTEGRTAAKIAFAQVQQKTPGATSSGVKTCWHFQKRNYLVDCKGYVKLPTRVCRLRVRVQNTSEGPTPRFIGPSTCGKSSTTLSSPGTVY